MIGLVALLSTLLDVTPARANPSVVAQCTSGGWTIAIGLNAGTEGTDLVEITSDDGRGHAAAWEATITSGKLRSVLRSGLVVNHKSRVGEQATVKLHHAGGTWAQRDQTLALVCAYD